MSKEEIGLGCARGAIREREVVPSAYNAVVCSAGVLVGELRASVP